MNNRKSRKTKRSVSKGSSRTSRSHSTRGSRACVLHGNAHLTGGRLSSSDLLKNKRGRIVSKVKSRNLTLRKRLGKHDFYCVGCRSSVRVENPRKRSTRSSGQARLVGVCPHGHKLSKFVKA